MTDWPVSTESQKLAILIKAGWRTAKDAPNPTARRLAKTAWLDMPEFTRATIERFAA